MTRRMMPAAGLSIPALSIVALLLVLVGCSASGSSASAGEAPATAASFSASPSVLPSGPGPAGDPSGSAAAAGGPASHPASRPPAVRSAKKGVGAWNFTGFTQALADSGASWYYNWSASPGDLKAPARVEFVPMIWGAASVTDANLSQAKRSAHVLLGFNEPDRADQSNLTVARALELWPRLVGTGMRLGAPAPATGAATAGGWLDQFLAGAAARGYRVDFITLHWYGSDFSAAAVDQLRGYLRDTYNRYHKPIWLTEYALINFGGSPKYPTPSQQAAFVTGSTRMLAGLSYVERYAWFALPATEGSGTGLYQAGAKPTAAGTAFRAA